MVDKDKKEKSDKKKSYKKVKKVKKTKGKLRLFKRKLRFIRKYKLKEKDEELGYPDGIYQKVFKICCIHPIGVLAGVYYSSSIATILATVLATMLSLSSINYWRNPLVSSIRRTIDMIVAFTAISYHIYLSLSTTNKILCLGLILLGAMMYPISLAINHCGYHQIGYIFHCLIHVFVMIGAIFTYRDYYNRKKKC
jgi:hypothetical protein